MSKILVANIGSTSYKYSLFEIAGSGCTELYRGSVERVTDYESAIGESVEVLRSKGLGLIDAVTFKTVLGKGVTGLREADGDVLRALEDMSFVAPAHNIPYAKGIRAFSKIMPDVRLVALFETSFYQWANPAWKRYAVPQAWDDVGIQRYGFHGASHKYAAERVPELLGNSEASDSAKMLYVNKGRLKLSEDFRMVNCHLGGSSSVCGILNGAAIGSSMGFSPQSGLPQNNRVGDLDSMAVPFAMKALGLSVDEAMNDLSKNGGLLGISGVSNDMRDIREAELKGDTRAKLAIEVQNYSTRFYIGGFMAELGGLEAISFSGGIAENNPWLRSEILRSFEGLGVKIDEEKNQKAVKKEGIISSEDSKVKVVTIIANEEIILAQETARYILGKRI